MKEKRTMIISTITTLIVGCIMFYFFLPPINISSLAFWFFVMLLLVFYLFMVAMCSLDYRGRIRGSSKAITILSCLTLCVIGIIITVNVVMSPVFHASSFANRIAVDESGIFTEDVKKVDFKSLPLLDKDSSSKLGDRVMGQMPELVSQFKVSNLYTQINYNNDIVRVTPLEYNGIFKFFANQKDGVKGYITVNSVTGEAKLVKLNQGMKYMPSALFSKDLDRHLRFKFPTIIFGEKSFEIDNEGNPYWIVPTLKYSGINLREEVTGIIILDPITGDAKQYKVGEIPSWVDHVYPANLIIEQVNDWGNYREGFVNSIFGQKNVVATTEGYNYTVMNDDVYLYTGITSVSSDESNLGFILTNMRTKKTHFYSAPGAEEYSAMASAEGQVQQMNYTASFPLLINLNNKPTYLISLKDNAGLVKMYAFVDVTDYQRVVVTDAAKGIEQAAKNYLNGEEIDYENEQLTTITIKINSIKNVTINGNSFFYITDTNNKKYRATILINEMKLPFLGKDDKIEISYIDKKDDVIEIIKIK